MTTVTCGSEVDPYLLYWNKRRDDALSPDPLPPLRDDRARAVPFELRLGNGAGPLLLQHERAAILVRHVALYPSGGHGRGIARPLLRDGRAHRARRRMAASSDEERSRSFWHSASSRQSRSNTVPSPQGGGATAATCPRSSESEHFRCCNGFSSRFCRCSFSGSLRGSIRAVVTRDSRKVQRGGSRSRQRVSR